MSDQIKPLTGKNNPADPVAQRPDRTGARRHWKTIDWRKAAELIAQGGTVEAVAAALGCEPDRILRNLRRSARFRHRIDRAVDRLHLSARLRFAALGDAATREMRRRTVQGQDPRLLQWLGEKLNQNHEQATMGEQWAEAARTPGGTANRRKCRLKRDETGRNGPERDETGCHGPRTGWNWLSNRPKRDGTGSGQALDALRQKACSAARACPLRR